MSYHRLLNRAYGLAARFPELGITPDIAALSIVELIALINYLSRLAES